jgi:hypothetical protein
VNTPAEQSVDEVINGLKIIRLNSYGIHEPDDESYPYKLVVNLSPPELMTVAFIMLYGGSEELIARGKTREAIDQFVERNKLCEHPRLRWMTIEGPNGTKEEIRR